MQENKSINILAICSIYNRSSATIKCLNSFYKQSISYKNINLKMVVVNDLSTDNSVELIKDQFPEIEIINTEGNFYWAKSMTYGFKNFWNDSFDFLMPFNDDIILNLNAINNIVTTYYSYKKKYPFVPISVVGSFYEYIGNVKSPSYGGLYKKNRSILNFEINTPSNQIKIVEVINMNFCLLDKESIQLTNFLDDRFIHSGADFDYALRLRKSGGVCIVGEHYSGACARNFNQFEFFNVNSKVTLFDKIKLLYSPKGLPITNYIILLKHYYKFLWFLLLPYPLLKVIITHYFPQFFNTK